MAFTHDKYANRWRRVAPISGANFAPRVDKQVWYLCWEYMQLAVEYIDISHHRQLFDNHHPYKDCYVKHACHMLTLLWFETFMIRQMKDLHSTKANKKVCRGFPREHKIRCSTIL